MIKNFKLFLVISMFVFIFSSVSATDATEKLHVNALMQQQKDIIEFAQVMPQVYDMDKIAEHLENGDTIKYVSNDGKVYDLSLSNHDARTRGNCTDVASKEWCDAHGYENNRPVGVYVTLTEKETRCFIAGLGVSSTLIVTMATGGSMVATVTAAFWTFVSACGY